jgi:hypothetical protein
LRAIAVATAHVAEKIPEQAAQHQASATLDNIGNQ